MTTVKRTLDLEQYVNVLPYASEMFGIYQPLLGWKSKRITERFQKGLDQDKAQILRTLAREMAASVKIRYGDTGQVEIQIAPGDLANTGLRNFDSVVMQRIADSLPPRAGFDPSLWKDRINPDIIDVILRRDVVGNYSKAFAQMRDVLTGSSADPRAAAGSTAGVNVAVFERYLKYESRIAGVLLLLVGSKRFSALSQIFYASRDSAERMETLARVLNSSDDASAYLDIENLDPSDAEQIQAVALSPISVVHLFRQYFFELDTFLGTPERHVWLSPGSSVELIEVHTRRTIVERTVETALDVLTKAESTTTTQDEISEAVKQENDQDIKAGASVTASYASVQATASFDYASSQKLARETSHKRMREQTDKLSTEIRKNFKSTFKSTTEVTDLSSTRHVLANNTDKLINYELRRKMRQVGVQVQDIGTFLCWQTYVDDPGASLGLAKLVHLAKPAELDAIPHPTELPPLQPFSEEKIVTIPFISIDGTDADNEDEVYVNGIESDDSEFLGHQERIRSQFPQDFVCSRLDYELTDVEFDAQGKPIAVSRVSPITNAPPRAQFLLNLDSVDFQGQNSVQVKLVLHWSPLASANAEIDAKNKALQNEFKAAEREAFQKAAIETLQDRVNEISKLQSRDSSDLREEERIVIYRALIQDMLQKNIAMPDDRTRHVVAELINSIFDVDKMLYFVSPEWWRPRLHRSSQQLKVKPAPTIGPVLAEANVVDKALRRGVFAGALDAQLNFPADFASSSTVGWGGVDDVSRDNYYITGESEPARMGSSLGWLLQLDGDAMRNAFLNAPWVKAVIPIRPGKEKAALNWLKGVEGMNGITDDVIYHTDNDEVDVDGDPLDGQPLIDVLFDLAEKIRRKHAEGIKTQKYPTPEETADDPVLGDPENTVTATPIDRVYEHGFFPLQGGFRANVGGDYEIFDQWIEILPTDQIVPVEVQYDPKTGRQI